MTVKILVTYDDNCVIAKPWEIPEVWKYFKETVSGCPIVMGSRTWLGLPEKLGSRHIVLSRKLDLLKSYGWDALYSDLSKAIDYASQRSRNVFVMGGTEVYEEALKLGLVDYVIAAEIKSSPVNQGVLPDKHKSWPAEVETENENFKVVIYKNEGKMYVDTLRLSFQTLNELLGLPETATVAAVCEREQELHISIASTTPIPEVNMPSMADLRWVGDSIANPEKYVKTQCSVQSDRIDTFVPPDTSIVEVIKAPIAEALDEVKEMVETSSLVIDYSSQVEVNEQSSTDPGDDAIATYRLGHTDIFPGTLSGVIYQGPLAVQTFKVNSKGVFEFKDICNPVARAFKGEIDWVGGKIKMHWDMKAGPNYLLATYEHKIFSIKQ